MGQHRLQFLVNLFWQHRMRKLAALALAVVGWYAIRGTISFENVITGVPLTIRLSDEWAVLETSTDVVDIVFKGSRDDLFLLNRGAVELSLDLRGRERAGVIHERLTAAVVTAPGSARAIDIQPGAVQIELDQLATRSLPVHIEYQGALPDGFELEAEAADPDRVVVSGPRRMIDTLTAVRTAPVPLDSRRQSFRDRVELAQPEGWQARYEPQRINARVTIRERSEKLLIKGVVVQALINPLMESSSVKISPSFVDVTVRGTAERLAQLDRSQVLPYVDCRELSVGEMLEMPVRVSAPAGILVVAIDPAEATVSVYGAAPGGKDGIE